MEWMLIPRQCLTSHLLHISRATFLCQKKIEHWENTLIVQNIFWKQGNISRVSAYWRLSYLYLPKDPSSFSLRPFLSSFLAFLLFSFWKVGNHFPLLMTLNILSHAFGNHQQAWETGRREEKHQEVGRARGVKQPWSVEVEVRMRVRKVRRKIDGQVLYSVWRREFGKKKYFQTGVNTFSLKRDKGC